MNASKVLNYMMNGIINVILRVARYQLFKDISHNWYLYIFDSLFVNTFSKIYLGKVRLIRLAWDNGFYLRQTLQFTSTPERHGHPYCYEHFERRAENIIDLIDQKWIEKCAS